MSYHISRWRYLWAYLVISILILLAIWLNDRAFDIPAIVSIITAAILLVIFEIRVRRESLSMSSSGIEYRKNKSVHKLSFSDIAAISASQSFYEHLLKYGNLKLHTKHGDFTLIGFQDVRRLEKIINKEVKK